MKIFKKPIFTGFAPNLRMSDVIQALGFLLLPWKWNKINKGGFQIKIETWLENYFNIEYARTFDSGRTALHYALKALGVGDDDEVLVQAYTCMVVSNAITWTGAKPVYVDIEDDFNMSAEDLKKKITNKSKVLIIQHTFGTPANLDKLLKFAKENNLKIIEDCAHSLGAKYNGKLTGTFGDIGMFSFGSDKVVSCVRGGALITNNENIAKKINEFYERLPESRRLKTIQHLFNYSTFAKGKFLYNLGIGKVILALAKKFNIINKIIYSPEKHGKQVLFYPSKLPNSLANILLSQLEELENNIEHRQEIAKIYNKEIGSEKLELPLKSLDSIYLRYPILVKNKKELFKKAKKQGIILGDWYSCPIAPCDIDQNKTGYTKGDCVNAEKLAKLSVNLPTSIYIKKKDALRVCKLLNKF